MDKKRRREALNIKIKNCHKCGEKMNVRGKTESAPGYGSLQSPVVIVGQSLCEECMEKQEPFYKGCGEYIDQSWIAAGIKSKKRLFITNVVHCHPENNCKSRAEWKRNCTPYLYDELDIVQPRLVIGLGKDAEAALRQKYDGVEPIRWPLTELPARAPGAASSPDLIFAPHPGSLRWKPKAERQNYVPSLTLALRWGFFGGKR
jgi:DNA polymerase